MCGEITHRVPGDNASGCQADDEARLCVRQIRLLPPGQRVKRGASVNPSTRSRARDHVLGDAVICTALFLSLQGAEREGDAAPGRHTHTKRRTSNLPRIDIPQNSHQVTESSMSRTLEGDKCNSL